jgi:hypothetical protein
LESKIKTISICFLATLGNPSSKDTISYNLKFNVNSILGSITGNKSGINVNTHTINHIDIKSDIENTIKPNIDVNLMDKIDTVKSNIDFDLINRINTKVNINFKPIDNINIISQETINYTGINLESKLLTMNHPYIYDDTFMHIYHIITNYPHFCLLPIIILIIPIIVSMSTSHPNGTDNTNTNNNINNETNANNTVTTSTEDNVESTVGIGTTNTDINMGDGGEDPDENERIGRAFFRCKDGNILDVSYDLYVAFVRCLKELVEALKVLRVRFDTLTIALVASIAVNRNARDAAGERFLYDTATTPRHSPRYVMMRGYDGAREHAIDQIHTVENLQLQLGNYLEELERTDPLITENLADNVVLSRVHDVNYAVFNGDENLITINPDQMSYYILDNNLSQAIQNNLGNIFAIGDTTNFFTIVGEGQHIIFHRDMMHSSIYEIYLPSGYFEHFVTIVEMFQIFYY